MEFESDGKLSEFLTKQSTGLKPSQVKDVVIAIGTKPGPMNLPSFDEYLENIMTVDKQMYEDMLNMRKKMIMEKVKERRIMKGKKKGYNYKVEEVKEEDIKNAVEAAKSLPIDSDDEGENYYDIQLINPIDEDADIENQPYSGFISIYKNENKTYTIVFFLSYFCGDPFFIDDVDVPFENEEELESEIRRMTKMYSDTEVINKLIEQQMEKERKENE